MTCLSPIIPKGASKEAPERVPCGRCGYCLANRAFDWSLRLSSEYKNSLWSWFITLTYATEFLPTILKTRPIIGRHFDLKDKVTLDVRDLQLFLKRVRKANGKETTLQFRYYACGEYGGRYGRPHYHILAFNLHPDTVESLGSLWGKGIVDVSAVESVSDVSNYVASYIVSAYATVKRLNVRPFATMSKRPYIGFHYVEKMKGYHRKLMEPWLWIGASRKQRLPRTLKKKIFSPDELKKFSEDARYGQWLNTEKELDEIARLAREDTCGRKSYGTALARLVEKRVMQNDYIIANTKKNDKF